MNETSKTEQPTVGVQPLVIPPERLAEAERVLLDLQLFAAEFNWDKLYGLAHDATWEVRGAMAGEAV